MLRIGVLGRTTIDVDVSFLVLIGLFVFNSYESGLEVALLWVPVLLVSILGHELAHAAVIGLFGYGPSRIVLLGTGGVTINQRRSKPWHEVLISVAGPASSLVVAIAAVVALRFISGSTAIAFCTLLYRANLFWCMLNLLPIAPLDGGHALRHLLRMFISETAAFSAAIWIGVVTGIAVVVYSALTGEWWVAVIMAFYAFRNFQAWQMSRSHHDDGSSGMN